jgi:Holliday junction resolvase-like predicted endonuclease
MKKFELVKATDSYMTSQKFSLPRQRFFYPSEASVAWTDKHGVERKAGACLRSCYFRRKDGFVAGPNSAYTEWVFALGKKVEEILVEQWKRMGIWVANNVKFFDPIHGISGEMDVILQDPATNELVAVEVKSLYGYYAVRNVINGTRTVTPAPKTSQLLQTLLYVDFLKDHNISYAKLVYYARDSAARREFDISLIEDGTTGEKRPCIDGVADPRFTMNDIYSRYELLQEYLDNDVVPLPDYELAWSEEKIEERKKIGDVTKSAYEKWQKGKEQIGDWNCKPQWCPFSKYCWNDKGESLL